MASNEIKLIKSFEPGELYFCANRILFAYQEWYKPASYMIPSSHNSFSVLHDGITTYTELLRQAKTISENMKSLHSMKLFIVEPGRPFLLLKHNLNIPEHNGKFGYFRDEHLEILYEEKIGYVFPKEDIMFVERND